MRAFRVRAAVLVCLSLACYGGHAELPPPQVPTHPTIEDATSSAVITDEVATLTYEIVSVEDRERTIAVLEHRLQIKILTPEGVEQAKFRLPMDGFTSVSRVVARFVDRFGNVTEMDPGVPQAVGRTEPGQKAPELKYLVFEVPEVEVGGVIDLLYTRVYTAADLVPAWVIGGPLPKLRSELAIIYPKGIELDHRVGRGATLVDEQPLRRDLEEGATRLVFTFQDIPAYFEEPGGPNVAWQAPWVATVVRSAELNGKKHRLDTWEDVSERVSTMLEKVGKQPLDGTPEERYRAVRDALAPIAPVGLGILPLTPAGRLMDGKPACARDAGALLYNVLADSGAKAFPALIASPDGPPVPEGFPGLYGFSRLAVAVDVRDEVAKDPTCREDPISRGLLCSVPENSYAFLDPTCSGCRYGEVPATVAGSRALVLLPDGPAWADVPVDPPERNRTMTQYRLALDVDGSLDGTMNGEVSGAVGRAIRGAFRDPERPPAERDAEISEVLLGPKPTVNLREVGAEGLDTTDEPLTVNAKLALAAEILAPEKFRINPGEVFGPAVPGRWRRDRRSPAILEAPAWYETVATIDLPVGYDVLADPVAKLVTPFAEYASGFALRERTLSFSRRLVIKQHIITAEQWPAFRELLDQIEEIERNGIPVFLTEEVEEPAP